MAYSIIGADGEEYGPVDKATLVQWAREGRVVERTWLREHENGRRYLACDMPELAALFAPGSAPSLSLPPATYAPVPAYRPEVAPHYDSPKSRAAAGALGVLLGWLGVHRFYLGYTAVGILQLLMSTVFAVLTCTATLWIAILWGITEGILCFAGAIPDAQGRPLSR